MAVTSPVRSPAGKLSRLAAEASSDAASRGASGCAYDRDLQGLADATLVQLSQQASVSQFAVESVVKTLAQAQHHDLVVQILRATLRSSAGVDGDAAPSVGVFNFALDMALRGKAFSEAWDLLELLLDSRRRADKYYVSILTKSLESVVDRRVVKRGITLVDRFISAQREDVDEIVFNSLLNVLGVAGDRAKLQATLSLMQEYGVHPSAVTYGTIVKAYGKARDIQSVMNVWSEMREKNLAMNPVTSGCVLDACVKCGCLPQAMAIFEEMRWSGIHRNTVLYATLIKGFAKTRDLASAVRLYQEMRMEQVPCNLVTFNSLMDVCVRCGDLSTAALFLQDMMHMGFEPDLITFSTLIKGYSLTGDVRKALALRHELKIRGLRCDEIMYNSLIDGCVKARSLQDGLMVFQEMCENRVAPSNITFSILVKLYFEVGKWEEAFALIDSMGVKYKCTPTKVVYTVLMRCCSQLGGPALKRGAQLVCQLASQRGTKCMDQSMVAAMLAGSLEHSDFETAALLVRDFLAPANGVRGGSRRSAGGGVAPDALHAFLLALGASGEEERMEALLEHLKQRGFQAAQLSQLRSEFDEGASRAATTAEDNQAAADKLTAIAVASATNAANAAASLGVAEAPTAGPSPSGADGMWQLDIGGFGSLANDGVLNAYNQWCTAAAATATAEALQMYSPYFPLGFDYSSVNPMYLGLLQQQQLTLLPELLPSFFSASSPLSPLSPLTTMSPRQCSPSSASGQNREHVARTAFGGVTSPASKSFALRGLLPPGPVLLPQTPQKEEPRSPVGPASVPTTCGSSPGGISSILSPSSPPNVFTPEARRALPRRLGGAIAPLCAKENVPSGSGRRRGGAGASRAARTTPTSAVDAAVMTRKENARVFGALVGGNGQVSTHLKVVPDAMPMQLATPPQG